MNPQYEILAKCLFPTHMLEWFELTNVEVKPKEKTVTQDTESDESPVNVIHLYPDIEMAYSLTHSLRMIFAQKCDKEAGRKSIKKW